MSADFTFKIEVKNNASFAIKEIEKSVNEATKSVNIFSEKLVDAGGGLFGIQQIKQALSDVGNSMKGILAPGIAFDKSMKDLQSIIKLTDREVKEITQNSKELSRTFGEDASQAVEASKIYLSQLNPEIAKNAGALKKMTENAFVLSKTMGGDVVGASNLLSTAMNQYQVDTTDATKASEQMAKMMNIMSAGAQEGAAELPEIDAALKVSGTEAKKSNVSFEELNSSIQVLAAGGKKGADAGNAIRNVLSEMSRGRFQMKDVREELERNGISLEGIMDKNVKFSDRLKMLSPLLNDSALLTKMFGKENSAAATILIRGANEVGEMGEKITGTNAAYEQAEVVMSSYEEKQKRVQQQFNSMKIAIFEATSSFMPYVQAVGSGVSELGDFAFSIWSVSKAMSLVNFKEMIDGIKKWKIWTNISSIATRVWGGITKGTIFTGVIPAIRALGVAIMNIPILGWIAAIVAGLIALGTYLWNNVKSFRATMYGLWEAIKVIFQNIGAVFVGLWEHVIKPVFNFLWSGVKMLFNFYKMVFMAIYDIIKSVVLWVWDLFTGLWNYITQGAQWLWEKLSGIFGGVASFFNEWIITPIRTAFSSVWNFIVGIFNKIKEKLTWIFKPIIKLWDKIFGEGKSNVTLAFKEGYAKGEKEFDKEKSAGASGENLGVTQNTANGEAGMGDKNKNDFKDKNKNGGDIKTPSAGAMAGRSAGGSGIKNITINIQDLIKEVHFTKTTTAENFDDLKRKLIETLTGAVSDANHAIT